jgi:hypothetical protein
MSPAILFMSVLAGFSASAGDALTVSVQWEAASPSRPWLRQVRIVPVKGTELTTEPIGPQEGMPHGLRVRVAPKPGTGSFRVELADDYGFTLSADLLRREPLVWLKDMGIFASARGDFASAKAARDALAAEVEAARQGPLRSTSEKYFAWNGYDEARPKQDDRAFEFAYRAPRPREPRRGEAIAVAPEASYPYFCQRVPDVKHHRMFLGWPNVCQEFYVLSNGSIGVSSSSALGTGHPAADDFVTHFGAGAFPVFKGHGDRSVAQSIEDGYHIIAHTRWRRGASSFHATALAYPLGGEEVRTGYEPLAAFVRLRRLSGQDPIWLKIRADHWGAGKPKPLAGLATARIRGGRLLAGARTVLAFDHAAATIAAATNGQVLVKLSPQENQVDLVIPYIAVDEKLVQAGLTLGFDRALAAAKEYWDARLAKGTQVGLPDPVVVNMFKTLYPRTLVTGDLDAQGDYALKTSPLNYDYVWLHVTAYGIEALARRGYFEEAKQYLEAGFRWQGSQRSEASKEYTSWDGFFTAPPRYTALLWLNYHGWFQWAAARYFQYSDDRAWLDAKLPALIKSLEWTAAQRKLTMRDNPDGSRPINYGWLPPGRVTDGSAGTSPFTDCVNWLGSREVVRVLERIGHPRAAEFRRMADDYRQCIVRGLRLAAREREPVRLNDGTLVPYVPAYLESKGHEENMWYAAVVDGGLVGLLQSGVVPPRDPLENWALGNLEDNLFVMAPNLADEGHFAGHIAAYLRRDQPKHAIYTFYSLLATQSDRQTLTTFEHRSWGSNRIYDLSPWPLHYYGSTLLAMLCYDEGDELVYCPATPEAWLAPGKEIRVDRLQTRFGPTSFRLKREAGRIAGTIQLPTRYRPSAVRLRLRTEGPVGSVRLGGKPAEADRNTPYADGRTFTLPAAADRVEVEATVKE